MRTGRERRAARTRTQRHGLTLLRVRPCPGDRSSGRLCAGTLALPCKLGPAGLTRAKREGDGATPVGRFRLVRAFYRADREPRPALRVPCRATQVLDGWCDDPGDPRYNRPLRLPSQANHETMWRADRLYDLLVVIDYNASRPRKGRGSAIFLHAMHPEGRPTAGCVALAIDDLRRLLPRLGRACRIAIG